MTKRKITVSHILAMMGVELLGISLTSQILLCKGEKEWPSWTYWVGKEMAVPKT
jgi:hypothetical protein